MDIKFSNFLSGFINVGKKLRNWTTTETNQINITFGDVFRSTNSSVRSANVNADKNFLNKKKEAEEEMNGENEEKPSKTLIEK